MTKVLEVPLYVNNWKSDIVKEIKQFELFGCCKCENLAQSIVFAGDSILLSSFCDTSRHYLWHFLPQRDRKYNRAVTKPPSSGQCGHFCGITKNVQIRRKYIKYRRDNCEIWQIGMFHISQRFNHISGSNCPGSNCLLRKMDSLAFYFQALEFHPVDLTAIRRERLLLQGWLSEKSKKWPPHSL